MSAAEVIAIIEALPPAEQQQVREYMAKKSVTTVGVDGVRWMDLAKAKAIGEGIFDRHPELFRRLAQ